MCWVLDLEKKWALKITRAGSQTLEVDLCLLADGVSSAFSPAQCIVIGLQSTGEARTREVLDENEGHLNCFVSAAEWVVLFFVATQGACFLQSTSSKRGGGCQVSGSAVLWLPDKGGPCNLRSKEAPAVFLAVQWCVSGGAKGTASFSLRWSHQGQTEGIYGLISGAFW